MKYISFLIGILTWPLLEYSLHRYLGHVLKINTLFKKEHTRHHVETNYFAPLTYKVLAAIPICIFTVSVVGLITQSWESGVCFTVGFIFMYSFYEWVHWNIHAHAPKTNFGMRLRKHHLSHHFHNPRANHGVTSAMIDKLAGTFLPVTIVKIPRNIALPWLFEHGKDTIDPKFKNDFQFR